MRKFIKNISRPFLRIILKWYQSKIRIYTVEGLSVQVHPDVFPPYLTFSTKILVHFLKTLDLKDKTLLELGCGCGIISLYAAKKEAKVTASDINEIALEYVKKAAFKNNLQIESLYSDLFENLQNRHFNYVIINPPFYQKKPKNIEEQAWFCGENFEYFEKLFKQLKNQFSSKTNCFIILSEDCNTEKINSIALKNRYHLKIVKTYKNWFESNYIYKVENLV